MSTKEVLSEDEIDALMDTVEDTPQDPEALDENGEYQLFDFAARDQALLGQIPALGTINEKVCNELDDTLVKSFRMPFDTEIQGMEMLKLDECIKSLPEFSAINTVKFDITKGLSLVVIGGALLSEVIDRYFGSSSGGAGLPLQKERPLTATEARINERLLSHVLAGIQVGWQEVAPFEVKLLDTETNPDFVKFGTPEDVIVRFNIQFTLGEFSDHVQWLLPYAALEALRPKLGSLSKPIGDDPSAKNWSQLLTQEVRAVELDLTAVFSDVELSLREIMNLRSGSIIPIRIPDRVNVFSGNVPIFSGEYGSFEANKAVSLTKRLTANDI